MFDCILCGYEVKFYGVGHMRRWPLPALYILYWVEVWLITIIAIQNVKMVHLRIVFVCSSTAFDCEEHLQVAVDAYNEWKQKPKHVH